VEVSWARSHNSKKGEMMNKILMLVVCLIFISCAQTVSTINIKSVEGMKSVKGVSDMSIYFYGKNPQWQVRAYLKTPCGETTASKKADTLEEAFKAIIKESECLQKCSEKQ